MIIDTSTLEPHEMSEDVYNCLDVCATHEVLGKLLALPPLNADVYRFELALQAPLLEMMLRGWRVNMSARHFGIQRLEGQKKSLLHILNAYGDAVWDAPINAQSPQQLKALFYNHMRLPKQYKVEKGVRKVSTNRSALEKLRAYFYALPIVEAILKYREVNKQLSVLKTEVSSDGRMRTSYNITTETGRLSSSQSAEGTGSNLQNITEELRHIFVADPGWKLCSIDKQQSESRDVGWYCGTVLGDWSYLDACESGDLHTAVARMAWPEQPWTGDLKLDRKIAETTKFYRELSLRDGAKRFGHGCVTPDHEVLTPDGWVPIAAKPQTIMTWSETESAFASVQAWHDAPYSGELIDFEGNSVSLRMTPNHRVPYYAGGSSTQLKVRYAADGPGRRMPLGDGFVGGLTVVPARLIAAFMSDGCKETAARNYVRFHLRKQRKIDRLKELCALYGYDCDEQSGERWVVRCSTDTIPFRAGPFMLNWTAECLDEFLDEYQHWDGHISSTAVCLTSTDHEHLEWIQTLGRLRGIGGQIDKGHRGGFDNSGLTYRLQQNRRCYADGNCMDSSSHAVSNERVLCPTVPSSFFYVRRNGKICVTGNSNYNPNITPTFAASLKVQLNVLRQFHERYHAAFPCIPLMHQRVAQELQTMRTITNDYGRTRHFFGRVGDDDTIREAIAYRFQSNTADCTNLGLWRVWKHRRDVQLLAQVHDAIVFQFRECDPVSEQALIEDILRLIEVHFEYNGRKFCVPGEASVGWNWGKQTSYNPDGLRKFSPNTPDTRKRTPILDVAC